jgi:hypothetical protein
MLLLRQSGPAGGVDDARDGFTSWRRWRWRWLHVVALFATGATHGCRQPVVAPRPVLPGVVGDVGPRHGLSWLQVMSRHAHSLPCVRGLTSDSSFHVHSGWGLRRAPMQLAPSPEAWRAPSGSGETNLLILGSDEVEPMPKGSGKVETMLWGSDEATVTPLDHPGESIVDDHQSPFCGYPN